MIAALTGFIAGTVHVWSGPDHLAAIAPLAARRRRRAWLPGIRWGLGHSAGVAVVGLLALWLRDRLPVDLLSTWGERLVGIMLFGVGLWAFRRAMNPAVHAHEHEHDGERHVHFHTHAHPAAHGSAEAHQHRHMAFGIGLLHGLAGSSHFFGVLPSLVFPSQARALLYLVMFCVGAVLSMASFSWLLGALSSRLAVSGIRSYRGLLAGCAVTAMGVGCFWLAASWR